MMINDPAQNNSGSRIHWSSLARRVSLYDEGMRLHSIVYAPYPRQEPSVLVIKSLTSVIPVPNIWAISMDSEMRNPSTAMMRMLSCLS